MEENTQVAEATNSEEVIELEIAQEEESLDSLKAQLEAEREAKKQILARAHAAEAKAKSNRPAAHESKDEIIDLRLDGYSKEDAEFILRNGGRKALEDNNSIVSIALKAKKEQSQAEVASSKTTGGTPTSEVERKHTPEQLASMSIAELQKLLPHAD